MYNILIGRMLARFFPLALLLSFLFALLFSLSSTTHILSVAGKKLGIYNG